MLRAFGNAFKIPDLRNKILFTLLIVVIYRFGAHVPVPVVNLGKMQAALEAQQDQGLLSLINLFSGGALANLAIFALGIMPYITSSIIMQLLQVVIPRLEKWRQEGESGQKKITQWTRYLTVTLALLQATGIAFLFHSGGPPLNVDVFDQGDFTFGNVALIVLTLTAGTALLMWMGELITQRGIGNGMSILIFISVISTLPSDGTAIWVSAGQLEFFIMIAMMIGIIIAVVFMEQGQRRIPVQYAKRVVGRKMTQGQSTYIPLKVNQSGVIPIIFASSVLYFPSLIATTVQWDWLQNFVQDYMQPNDIFYMVVYALFIVFFAYFYTAIAFNPVDTADNIRKYGGFIPGIRPGAPTAKYLNDVLVRITLPGAMFLAAIALIPSATLAFWGVQQVPFGGTSILITVGVALETMKQLESQLLMRHYEGFLS